MENQQIVAKEVYKQLEQKRKAYIDRAVKCAKITIPHLFPNENQNGNSQLMTPYQSIGARGVNNLSSKLMLALFPPNETFFRLGIAKDLKAEIMEQPDKLAEVEQALMRIESTCMKYMEENQYRVTNNEAMLQLVVAGNVLAFQPPDKDGIKLYNLKNYVVQRDALSTIVKLCTKDTLLKATLPVDLQSMVADKKNDAEVEIYTYVYLENDVYKAFQEIDGKVVPQSEQTYPKDALPYLALRLYKQDGEDYGRSYVEQYLGDLVSLEKLSKALVNMAAISARVLYLVNPNGMTRARHLVKAQDGEFVPGRTEDIQALQLNKYPDLQVTKATCDAIEQRLMFAFLLSSVVQRNADRVTAEEIRTVASELEDTLGGVYSILSQELQLPLVKIVMKKLERQGAIPQLPQGFVEPTIVTGLEALGRGHDFNKLTTLLQVIGQLPDTMSYLKMNQFIISIATSLGIDTTGLVKTDEEIQAEQQQAQDLQMAMQAMSIPQDQAQGGIM